MLADSPNCFGDRAARLTWNRCLPGNQSRGEWFAGVAAFSVLTLPGGVKYDTIELFRNVRSN